MSIRKGMARIIVILGVIVTIALLMLKGQAAQAETLPFLVPAGEHATATSGAAFGVTVPEGPIDAGNGATVSFVPTVPNPLAMNEGIEAQVQELNQAVKPGDDGVRRVTGFSAGGLGGCHWAMQSDPADGPVELLLSGTPIWDGSLKDILPDTPIADFCDANELPEHVTVKANVLRNDGYASCLNEFSSLVTCPLGILIGHYCVLDNIVHGQCYSSFNGPVETFQVGNTTYNVGQTRNPVAVASEALGKQFDPNFVVPAPVEQALEGFFPQGQPGVPANGITPRDILQPEGGQLPTIDALLAPVEQLVNGMLQNPVASAQPQAKAIPQVVDENPITEAAAPVITALPEAFQAPAQQLVNDIVPDFVPQAWTDEVLPQAPAFVPPTFDAAPAQLDIVDAAADAATNAGVPADLVGLATSFLGAH